MTPRLVLGRYGRRGVRVVLWIEGDRIRAQWREKSGRRHRSWPDTATNRKEAKVWAEEFAQARLERRAPQELLTVAQLWSRFRAAEFQHLRPKTQQFYLDCWRYWEVFVGPERIAEDFGLATVMEFRADMETRTRPLAINTMRRIIQTVKTVYAWGAKLKLLSRNDVREFTFKVAKEKRPVSPPEYRREEFERVLAELPLTKATTWRAGGVIALCGLMGAREKSVLHLRWDDINLVGDTIRWRPEWDKLGRDEVQALRPSAKDVLLAIRHWTDGKGWIFPAVSVKNRRETYGIQALWVALQEAEKRAGVRKLSGRAMHGLRRMAFNDALEASGGDLGVAMALIRDTDLKVVSKYLKRRDDRLRAAFVLMDRKSTANSTGREHESSNVLPFKTGAAGFEPATSRTRGEHEEPTSQAQQPLDLGETAHHTPRSHAEPPPETAPDTAPGSSVSRAIPARETGAP